MNRARASRATGPAATPAGTRPESLTNLAYTALEEMIVRLELPPGSEVSEARLCERLGIGRTPVREALLRLARERLVTILPRRGIVISEIDSVAQLRLLEFRREVERFVVQGAARQATPDERTRFTDLADRFEAAARANDDVAFMRVDREFNALGLATARNEFAAGAMATMQSLARRFWYQHYRTAADMPVAARLHADLARQIAAGDSTGAARALDALLDNIEAFTRTTAAVTGSGP
ncbi:MAG: GntR family transcriptional regulator [Betaproteobacteria bacterium]|nr:GntR family transcriptional regulator [Betaproteobacteria bacterium]